MIYSSCKQALMHQAISEKSIVSCCRNVVIQKHELTLDYMFAWLQDGRDCGSEFTQALAAHVQCPWYIF